MTGYFTNAGAWLAQRRHSLGMTQGEVAEELKIHSQFVSNWERGKCMPPKSCLIRLTFVFKIKRSDRNELLSAMLKDAEEQFLVKYQELL